MLLWFLCVLCCSSVFGATTVVEKREGRNLNSPKQQTGAYTTMYSTYDNAMAALERQSGLGGPGDYLAQPSSYSSYSLPPPPQPSGGNYVDYGPPVQQQYAIQPQNYGDYGNQGPQQFAAGGTGGFSDPGFSMQTGFEGFLVPNPWYGLLPWGGGAIAIAVIVFFVVKIALILLFLKIFKIGGLFKSEEDDGILERSYLPSYMNRENLANVASAVFNAIDRYNEIEEKEE